MCQEASASNICSIEGTVSEELESMLWNNYILNNSGHGVCVSVFMCKYVCVCCVCEGECVCAHV